MNATYLSSCVSNESKAKPNPSESAFFMVSNKSREYSQMLLWVTEGSGVKMNTRTLQRLKKRFIFHLGLHCEEDVQGVNRSRVNGDTDWIKTFFKKGL